MAIAALSLQHSQTTEYMYIKALAYLLNPFSTETVLLVGYWSPITNTLLYT